MKAKTVLGYGVIAAAASGAAIIAALVYQASINEKITTGELFSKETFAIHSNNLFDIGVVDVDGNGWKDIFTVSHHSRQSLLLYEPETGFRDMVSQWGFDQDLHFPDAEIQKHPPGMKDEGLYVFRTNQGLVFQLRGDAPAGSSVSGTVGFLSNEPVTISGSQPVEMKKISAGNGLSQIELAFQFSGEGSFVVRTPLIAIPFEITVDENYPLEKVFVGQRTINPKEHSFEFELNDRHGMAWADYDGDDDLDVFVTRGGIRNFMQYFPKEYFDELFENRNETFINIIRDTGIAKRSCPAYNVEWVDYDDDGDLDLYLVCHHGHANKLYQNDGGKTFHELGAATGLDLLNETTDTSFLWVDLLGNGSQELLISNNSKLLIFRRDNDRYIVYDSFSLDGITAIRCIDYDRDGDLDIFVSSYSGHNTLLVNEENRFSPADLELLGLPSASIYANWVDYDNDGLVDLHLMPQGLYRQLSPQRFEQTGLLKAAFPWHLKKVRATWYDADNDGFRDLLLATFFRDSLWKELSYRFLKEMTPPWARPRKIYDEWNIALFKNRGKVGNEENGWLQIDVAGPRFNRQSIGASIALSFANGGSTVTHVGHAEGSSFSQGHYTVYMGLGETDAVRTIDVTWPGGYQKSVTGNFRNEQVLVSY